MTYAPPWWAQGIIYQIYPRSFQDSDGDGIGDLPGIVTRLDYLAELGADAIWLSPIFPSPMADFGYDVSDYTGVDPTFGRLADLDRLIGEAHRRRLRVILDFVPNHTSDRHPWFVESRSSRDDPRRDWYIWRDSAPGGGPPNNWLSEFGGPAWTFDPTTGQYYYHAYLAAQPDLNWHHPAVADAMDDVLRFWLDRGIDGFRIDTVHHLLEDPQFRDNPENPNWHSGLPPTQALERRHTIDLPGVHEILARFRRVADAYDDRVLIGEAYLSLERLMPYYGSGLRGVQLPFNFHLIGIAWIAPVIADLIRRYEALLPPGAWPNWVLGNHDRSRIASRVGPAQARTAVMLLLTLRGTPTVYYGDELGLADVPIPADRVQDPWEKNVPGFGLGRDPVRTPIPWDGSPNAGFSSGEPWLPLGSQAMTHSVAAQTPDPHSMLSLHRRLIALRRAEPALAIGDYGAIDAIGDVLIYERRHDERRLIVCLNLGGQPASVDLERYAPQRVLLSTFLDQAAGPVGSSLDLRPAEGVVLSGR